MPEPNEIPYEVIQSILKGSGFPTAGDPCVAPPVDGRPKCDGKIEWDKIEKRHRCNKCAYGF